MMTVESSNIEAWEGEGDAADCGSTPANDESWKDFAFIEPGSTARQSEEQAAAQRKKSLAGALFVVLVLGIAIVVLASR
jgi:hypothetical protein